jgi:hypothetical protein
VRPSLWIFLVHIGELLVVVFVGIDRRQPALRMASFTTAATMASIARRGCSWADLRLGEKLSRVDSLREWRKKPTAGRYADGQMSLPSA